MVGTLIGGALGAVQGWLGSTSRNNALNKQIGMVEQQQREDTDWFNRRYNEDATQRADAQRLLAITEENIRKRNRAAAGTQAVMGGSEESVAATKEANAKAMADATSQIVAANEQRKDQIEQQYRQRKHGYDETLRGLEGQKLGMGDIINNVIGGAASGMTGFGGLL